MTQAPAHPSTTVSTPRVPGGLSDADLAALVADDSAWPRPGGEPVQAPEVSPWWRDAPWGGSGRPWLDSGSPGFSGAPGHEGITDAGEATAVVPVPRGVDAARRPAEGAGAGFPLVLLGGAGSLALALLTGRAWGRAATNAGELDWNVLTTSDAHAGLFTLGWLLATLVLGTGWLLCHARRRANQGAFWAMLVGTAVPVLSVLGALAMLAPALDNIPG